VDLDQQALTDLVTEIWSTMMGLEAAPSPAPDLGGADAVTAWVDIAGAWSGSVVVELPEPHALLAASAMFGMDLGEVSDAEVADAIGELANIAAGAVKAWAPAGCTLGLPVVAVGGSTARPAGATFRRSVMACGDDRFAVEVAHHPGG
jgi:chemotaxis protein CheX